MLVEVRDLLTELFGAIGHVGLVLTELRGACRS